MNQIYSFTYYWNARRDANGRPTAFFDGYQEGDPLQIAYRGLVEIDTKSQSRETLQTAIAETLFRLFNDPESGPADYHGPSMSVGSVLEIQGSFCAVEFIGFKLVDIWNSLIRPGDRRWYTDASVQQLTLLG